MNLAIPLHICRRITKRAAAEKISFEEAAVRSLREVSTPRTVARRRQAPARIRSGF